jgi:hypothetical protein
MPRGLKFADFAWASVAVMMVLADERVRVMF